MVKLIRFENHLKTKLFKARSDQRATIMKNIKSLVILSLFLSVLSLSSMAYAEAKPWVWSWWESHWDGLDFNPYMEEGKHPHNSQWDESSWKPEHWEAQSPDALDVVKGFYFADILRDQYVDNDLPVLEVGPAFYMLGGQDKRRVVEMVDYAYGITSEKEFGMFMLYDWKTGKAIGSYTQYGLQLQ